MVQLEEVQLFTSDEYGRRRSVLFAIVVATGFLAVAAGAGTIASGSSLGVAVALLLVGLLTLAGGVAIAMGEVDEYLFE